LHCSGAAPRPDLVPGGSSRGRDGVTPNPRRPDPGPSQKPFHLESFTADRPGVMGVVPFRSQKDAHAHDERAGEPQLVTFLITAAAFLLINCGTFLRLRAQWFYFLTVYARQSCSPCQACTNPWRRQTKQSASKSKEMSICKLR
jgi:hypothetical protein